MDIKLTQFSHGAGCGCKIAPAVLETILETQLTEFKDDRLVVGNDTKDDAAVYNMGNGLGVVSTTDFFMPIVDDPHTFGRIAATNALSDVYAMGARPLMAIAILGWPLDKLGPEVAQQVVEGGRQACHDAGIALAGGHSIDCPEPVFGLAVTGLVDIDRMKRNASATAECRLYLTKPLGIGVFTTAEKKGKLKDQHQGVAAELMCQLNSFGAEVTRMRGITAMTDVTGFGLLGHLLEMAEGSNLGAKIFWDDVPMLDGLLDYINEGCIPGGTERNFESYGDKVEGLDDIKKAVLCDPQTSGGLLIAVEPGKREEDLLVRAASQGISMKRIGELEAYQGGARVRVLK